MQIIAVPGNLISNSGIDIVSCLLMRVAGGRVGGVWGEWEWGFVVVLWGSERGGFFDGGGVEFIELRYNK